MALSTGIDRTTGKIISGFAHVEQSIGVLLTTRLNTRVMRRGVGSSAPDLVDAPISPMTLVDYFASIATAMKREPRFRITRMVVDPTTDAPAGRLVIAIQGVYYPRGHLGDFSVSEPKIASVTL